MCKRFVYTCIGYVYVFFFLLLKYIYTYIYVLSVKTVVAIRSRENNSSTSFTIDANIFRFISRSFFIRFTKRHKLSPQVHPDILIWCPGE